MTRARPKITPPPNPPHTGWIGLPNSRQHVARRPRRSFLLLTAVLLIGLLGGGALLWLGRDNPDRPAFLSSLLSTSSTSATPATGPANSAAPLSHHQFEAVSEDLARRLRTDGPEKTFTYISEQIATDRSFARDCHPLMHMLGHEAVAYYGSFAGAMRHQNEICNSGFTHGILEAGLLQAPDITQAAREACLSPVSARSLDVSADSPAAMSSLVGSDNEGFGQWQCFHGVGHGIMAAKSREVSASLAVCGQLPSRFADNSCANGVFMEHFIVVDHSGTIRAGASASFDTCQQQATANYKSHCYYYAPTAYLGLHRDDYQGAYRWCLSVTKQYIATCVSGVGGQIMKDNITNPAFVSDVCRRFDVSQRTNCVEGAVGTYVNHYASSAVGEQLCKREFKKFRTSCYRVVHDKKLRFSI